MARFQLLFCVFLSLAESEVQYDKVINFVINFFQQEHNISLITVHTCWDRGAERKLSLALNRNMMSHSRQFDVTRQVLYTSYGIFVDIDCPGVEGILKEANKHFMFTSQTKWLILDLKQKILMTYIDDNNTNTSPTTDSLNYFKALYILPDSDVTIVIPTSENDLFAYSIFKPGINSTFIICTRNESRSQRENLRGISLISATVIFHPQEFRGMESMYMKHLDTSPKMHYPVVKNLADQLNFKLNLIVLNDYGWEINGTFSSVMGLLQRREIDMAATGFFIRDDRMRVSDFTAETYFIKTAIIFRQPSLSSVSNIFTMPFNLSVWYSCIGMCVVVILAFSVEVLWTRSFGVVVESLHGAGFIDIVTLVLGAICQQGSHVIPHAVSARITLLALSVASLFLFTSYSANIVALLQSQSSALTTISDLVESPLTVGIQDLNYNRIYFQESTDLDTRKLYRHKVAPQGMKAFCTPVNGIQQVRVGYFAYQVEVALGYQLISDTFTEKEKCGLSEMQLFPIPILALPLVKHSGYRDIITQKIRWQREVGILNQIANKWLPHKPQCESIRGGGFVSVGLVEFFPALWVLFYGISAAIVVFLLELLHFYKNWFWIFCKNRRKMKLIKNKSVRKNVMIKLY